MAHTMCSIHRHHTCVCVFVCVHNHPSHPSRANARSAPQLSNPPPHHPKAGKCTRKVSSRTPASKANPELCISFCPCVCVCCGSVCVCERACSPPALALCTRAHPMLQQRGARAFAVDGRGVGGGGGAGLWKALCFSARVAVRSRAIYERQHRTHTHVQHACARAFERTHICLSLYRQAQACGERASGRASDAAGAEMAVATATEVYAICVQGKFIPSGSLGSGWQKRKRL